MIAKLPKFEVLKQSNLGRLGLRLHLRYSSTNPLTKVT
jgi:hypothetical protein